MTTILASFASVATVSLVSLGLGVRKALWVNLGSASMAILGTTTVLIVESVAQQVDARGIPVTAGGFVYLAAADLIPELQHDRSFRALTVQTSLITMGIGVMWLLTLVA